ncbi:MAG: LiaF domain-containing protein [Spirochaetota bacterium]
METGREHALEILTRAFSGDLVSMEEYERRAGEIQKARSVADIDLVVADLSGVPEAQPSRNGTTRPDPASRVDPNLSGSQTLACVMGDRQLQGDWLNGSRVDSFTLMGSTKIDLRDVAMPDDHLKIQALVLMGETRVVVPRGMAVRLNVFPFMGEATAKRDVNQRVVPGEPYVIIEGFVMMGSLVVVAQD